MSRQIRRIVIALCIVSSFTASSLADAAESPEIRATDAPEQPGNAKIAPEQPVSDAREPASSSSRAAEYMLNRIQHLLTDPSPPWQPLEAAEPDQARGDATEVLRTMAAARDTRQRRYALEGLTRLAGGQRTEHLLEALTSTDTRVQHAAIDALRQLDETDLRDAVLSVYLAADGARRLALDQTIGQMAGNLVTSLTKLLNDPSASGPRARAAAYVLGRLKAEAAIGVLASRAWTPDEQLAFECARALAHIETPAAVPYLTGLLNHPEPLVRQQAMDGLAAAGGPRAVTALGYAAAGYEANAELRRYAIALLSRYGGDAATPYLIEALVRQPRERRLIAEALTLVTGQRFGRDPRQWIEWYEDKTKQRWGGSREPGEPIRPRELRLPDWLSPEVQEPGEE